MRVDGATVERLVEVSERPLVSVFLPDRLELIKGAPALRRAHLDQFVAALWPARVADPAQLRPDAGAAQRADREDPGRRGWPGVAGQLGRAAGSARDRADERPPRGRADDGSGASHASAPSSGSTASQRSPTARARGRPPRPSFRPSSRPRSTATSSAASPATVRTATTSARRRGGRELRAYGSQGQQRLALLALLLAEREALAARRQTPPVMLLDDVMSELDRQPPARAGANCCGRRAASR